MWYKQIAKAAPEKLKIAGNNLIIGFKENSASTNEILFGCVNTELAQKSVPNPTNKSEKMNPKNILKIAKINNGTITANLDS